MIQVIITEQSSTIVVRGNGNYWNFRVVSYEGDCYNFWHNTLEEGTRHQMVDEARRTLQGMNLLSVIEIIALDSPAEWTEEDWQTTDERHWWELSGYPECDPDEDSECWNVEVEQFYCDHTSVEYYRFVGTKQEALTKFEGFNRKVTVTPASYEAWEAEDFAESWWLYVDVTDSDIDEYAQHLTERYTEDDNDLPF